MAFTKDHKLRYKISKQEALDLLFPGENLDALDIETIQIDSEDNSFVVAEKARESVQ